MPIRYYIDLDCRPRRELGGDEILQLLARWERAENVRAQFEAKYKVTDEGEMRFREKVVSAEGERETRETTVAALRGECSPLWDHSAACRGCPAALEPVAYACVGAVSLPISRAGEEWLVERVAPAGSRALELFLDACSAHGYGELEMLKNWRKAKFLESGEALRADRGGLLVTSDQVLNELFFVGDLMPAHALGVLIHLGALRTTDGREGDDLLDLIERVHEASSAEKAPMIDLALEGGDDEEDGSVVELRRFLGALFRAFSLEVPLAVRL